MKKQFITIAALLYTGMAAAQTMNVVVGNVTYAIPAAQAGDMTYNASADSITFLNKTIAINDINNIYVDNSDVSDNTVNVTYNGSTASAVIAGNIMQYVVPVISAANVSIIQVNDEALTEEITYSLTGTSTDGSFYMDGDYKATLVLNDLQLARQSVNNAVTDKNLGFAINIDNGKRINMILNGTNTLSDCPDGAQKACLMINGHSEFTGDGSLNVSGNSKHAIWTDEYLMTKKSFNGTITVDAAVKDGMNINQYLEHRSGTITVSGSQDDGIQVGTTGNNEENDGQVIISGGTLNITVTADDVKALKADSMITVNDAYSTPVINISCGNAAYAAKGMKSGSDINIAAGDITITTAAYGRWDTTDKATSACAAIKSDGNMNISGGTLTLTATGAGGKGINADGTLTISGGTTVVSTQGNVFYSNGTTTNANYTASTDRITNTSYKSSPKGIKADGAITLSGGNVTVTTTGNGGEGIESKSTLNISGGIISSTTAKDDAINAASHLTVSGGTVYAISADNDGLDANGNMYINGGTVYAACSGSPEVALDANTEQNYKLYLNGGTVIAFGGVESGASVSMAGITTTATANTSYALLNGTTVIAAWKSPTTSYAYSSMSVYSSSLSSGTSYSLYKGCTISGTSYFSDHYFSPATISGGTSSTLTASTSTSGGSQGGGFPGGGGFSSGGGRPGGR